MTPRLVLNRPGPAALLVALLAVALLWPAAPGRADGSLPVLGKVADLERVMRQSGARLTVVNYWATWCAPCRSELPLFVRLSKEFDPADVQVIGISLDYDPAMLANFLRKYPLNYPNYLGADALMEELGVGAIPKTIIHGPGGRPLAVMEGEITAEVLKSRIQALLTQGDDNAQ